GILGRGGGRHLVSFIHQQPAQAPADALFVIHDQDVAHDVAIAGSAEVTAEGSSAAAGLRQGIFRAKQVVPADRTYSKLPPWASAICRATARPRPTPSGLSVAKGSNKRSSISGMGPRPLSRTRSE